MATGENKGFTKNDMDRIGIFSELGYISIGDNYKDINIRGGFNEAAGKGKQLLPGGSKERCGLQHGYFNDKYGRVLEGEAYTDPVKLRRQHRINEAKKNLGKAWVPSNGDKTMNGTNTFYGTLSGPVNSFSPVKRPAKSMGKHGKNMYTNPGKKGTGMGYVGVTIGPLYSHSADQYDMLRENMKKEREAHNRALKGHAFKLNMHPKRLFDENPYRSDRALPPPKKEHARDEDIKAFRPSNPGKKDGGMKAGTFEHYPSHSVDPYISMKMNRTVNITNKLGKTFVPNPWPKSAPQKSIVNQNVRKSMNKTNYRATTSVMSF